MPTRPLPPAVQDANLEHRQHSLWQCHERKAGLHTEMYRPANPHAVRAGVQNTAHSFTFFLRALLSFCILSKAVTT